MVIDEGAVRAVGCIPGALRLGFRLYSMSVPPNIRGPNHCRIALGIETCIYCQSLTLFDKQLKYGVSGTEEHVFDFLSPPTCVYADSPRLTTIARSTITFPLVVVIHITASPTVLHDSPRDLNVKAISDQINLPRKLRKK